MSDKGENAKTDDRRTMRARTEGAKPYQAPRLKRFGSFSQITAGSGGGKTDADTSTKK